MKDAHVPSTSPATLYKKQNASIRYLHTHSFRTYIRRFLMLVSTNSSGVLDNPFMLLRLICFFILFTSINAACHEHCQWCNETSNICKECRHNLFLYNGTCVEECPDGYYENVSPWDRTWNRMVGNICDKSYKNVMDLELSPSIIKEMTLVSSKNHRNQTLKNLIEKINFKKMIILICLIFLLKRIRKDIIIRDKKKDK